MKFIPLETAEQIGEIKKAKGYNIIFKHNTTCPISKSAKSRLEQDAPDFPQIKSVYYLDLLTFRDISDRIADEFSVPHESPQLLVIKDGACTFNQSLYKISAQEAAEAIA